MQRANSALSSSKSVHLWFIDFGPFETALFDQIGLGVANVPDLGVPSDALWRARWNAW